MRKLLEYSQPLGIAVEWSDHVLSGEPSLVGRTLELEPRHLTRDEITGLVPPVSVDAEAVRWKWIHQFDRIDFVGINGKTGTAERGNVIGVAWLKVGASVELTAFDGPVAAAKIYAAQPRIQPPRVRVSAPTAYKLAVRVEWPDSAPLPAMRFYTKADRPPRLVSLRSEERGRHSTGGIEFTVPPVKDLVYAVLTSSSGDLLYWTRFSESRSGATNIGPSASDQALVDNVVRPSAVSGHALPWPSESRRRFAVIKEVVKRSFSAQAENVGESRDADVTGAYRIALLKHFGVEVESSALADLNRGDLGETLSLLLSGVDVQNWSPEDIVWALLNRSSEAFREVIRMFPKAKEARRALPFWNQFQAASHLFDRLAKDSRGRDDMTLFLQVLESHIRDLGPEPPTAILGGWKDRLDSEDRGDPTDRGVPPEKKYYHSAQARETAAHNEKSHALWLSRLGNLLVAWRTGGRAERVFEPQEIERLLQMVEQPPSPGGGEVDPWMKEEAQALEASAILRYDDSLADAALRTLRDVIIANADLCSRFHSFVHAAEMLSAPHPALRKRLPFDRSLPMKTLNENARIATRLVRNAERQSSDFPEINRRLAGDALLNVLLQPNHPAIVKLIDEVRSDLARRGVPVPVPQPSPVSTATGGGGNPLETAITAWWSQLIMLESALHDVNEQTDRLQSIYNAIWPRLERPLVTALKVLRTSPASEPLVSELDPLIEQARMGNLVAPKQICEILVKHPAWSQPLENGANGGNSYGRK